MIIRTALLVAGVAGLGLSGCVTAPEHLTSDFGVALRQDLAAQIADPDARYTGDPAPGSDGARVGLAQDRYAKGKVVAPTSGGASGVSLESGSTTSK
ncbi:hypothetical protein [Phenylobacterium sp.]|uniref:hypothetical protein n=1 Tax=Phenylobacterium sp. TaxID=1871053 RepID=UPI0035B23A16